MQCAGNAQKLDHSAGSEITPHVVRAIRRQRAKTCMQWKVALKSDPFVVIVSISNLPWWFARVARALFMGLARIPISV
jgi:hypothetical protein